MEQQVRFRNSFWIAFLLFIGCRVNENSITTEKVNSNDASVKFINGVAYKANELFTGLIYTLYPGTTDTAEISGFLKGRENGEWKKFYPNRSLKEKREFDNGKKIGELIAYWENGNKKLDYFFENDEYNGTCREWNVQGLLIKEMHYAKGYEEGSQKMFYDNGKVRSNYIMISGRRYGLLGTKNCVNVSDSVFKK